ncbi:hypothetical protein ANCDUO_19368, partial [Ancylostoma duodenale]
PGNWGANDRTSDKHGFSRRRVDSSYDLSNCGLQRAPSTSSLMEKERKIADLERQLGQEKESLVRQHHNAVATSEELRRQLEAAESAADGLAERLKRAQADAECWKRKHEEAVQEAKNDILNERCRH